MPRLRHLELRALSDTLLALYSPGPHADLPAKLFAALRRHFGCDNSYNEFDSESAMRLVYEPEFPGRLFSEEERATLNLLKPHFSQAFIASKLFSYFADAAESNGQAWLVVDSSGRILFETGKAVDWLTEYFGQNGSLPPQLRDWLKRRVQSLANSNCLNLTPKQFSIQRGAKRLNIQSLSPVHASEHRLVLSETSEALDVRDLFTPPSAGDVESRCLASVAFTPSGPLVYQWQIDRSTAQDR
jgi:hypothetical protein